MVGARRTPRFTAPTMRVVASQCVAFPWPLRAYGRRNVTARHNRSCSVSI